MPSPGPGGCVASYCVTLWHLGSNSEMKHDEIWWFQYYFNRSIGLITYESSDYSWYILTLISWDFKSGSWSIEKLCASRYDLHGARQPGPGPWRNKHGNLYSNRSFVLYLVLDVVRCISLLFYIYMNLYTLLWINYGLIHVKLFVKYVDQDLLVILVFQLLFAMYIRGFQPLFDSWLAALPETFSFQFRPETLCRTIGDDLWCHMTLVWWIWLNSRPDIGSRLRRYCEATDSHNAR